MARSCYPPADASEWCFAKGMRETDRMAAWRRKTDYSGTSGRAKRRGRIARGGCDGDYDTKRETERTALPSWVYRCEARACGGKMVSDGGCSGHSPSRVRVPSSRRSVERSIQVSLSHPSGSLTSEGRTCSLNRSPTLCNAQGGTGQFGRARKGLRTKGRTAPSASGTCLRSS